MVDIDLGPIAAPPPRELFHGTARASLNAILDSGGLRPRGRHHVHLSPDIDTALRVGRRHGPPVVLEVDAARMAQQGHRFFVTANRVWLTERVPAEFLSPRRNGSDGRCLRDGAGTRFDENCRNTGHLADARVSRERGVRGTRFAAGSDAPSRP